MKVGDRVKLTIELECIFAPGCSKGHMMMTFQDCLSDVNDGDERIGEVGGAMGGSLSFMFNRPDGMTLLRAVPKTQWDALALAMREQHGVDIEAKPARK